MQAPRMPFMTAAQSHAPAKGRPATYACAPRRRAGRFFVSACLAMALSALAGCEMGPAVEQPNVAAHGFDAVRADLFEPAGDGYSLGIRGDFTPGWALKRLDEPFRERAVFRATIRSQVADIPANIDATVGHVIRNGFLAFGDEPADAALVKSGIWIGGYKYSSFRGPWTPRLPAVFQDYDADKTFEVEMVVDLQQQTVTATVDGVKFVQPIEPRLEEIRWYGYWVLNTRSRFGPIFVEGR